ncbi:amino acid ABC transporter permease [Microvirga sp. G4-2]|uniref:amino acid ABC transporter permease n=1 Tax=Microvirga sp. G4-2 TaxID=3434467 RepID=UPI004043980E
MERLIDNYLNADVLAEAFPKVLQGFSVTVYVSLLIILFGIATGLAFAVLRCMNVKAINAAIVAYVDVFRTLPQLVVIIFVYFGLPYAGISLSPFATTVLALGAVLSAFATEIFYSAIMALPRGQWDAASALGFGYFRTLFSIILPQAVRLAIPLLTNRAIAISKGTALGTAVALPEALGQAQSVTAIVANPSPLTLAAAFYLTFFIPLVVASRWIEHRYGHGH